jgi:hypothetical protein
VDWAGWATFGFAATVLLTSVMVGAQLAGWTRMDIPYMLGTISIADPDKARVLGFVIHLVNGQIFALFYAAAFALLGEATWWWGAVFGLFHGLVATGIIVPLIPGFHPHMASDRAGPGYGPALEPPGALALNYGRGTPVVALIAHVAYGVTLGTFLGP